MKNINFSFFDVLDFLKFQCRRNYIVLYKRLLSVVEDLEQEHVIMMEKLSEFVDEDVLNKVNYFNEEKYAFIRKKILDIGNEAIRETEGSLENVQKKINLPKETK